MTILDEKDNVKKLDDDDDEDQLHPTYLKVEDFSDCSTSSGNENQNNELKAQTSQPVKKKSYTQHGERGHLPRVIAYGSIKFTMN